MDKLNMRKVASTIVEALNMRLVLEQDYKTPATELCSTTNTTFAGTDNLGKEFQNFPCSIKTCMSGNTYIKLTFVNEKGERVYEVASSKNIEYRNSMNQNAVLRGFKFPEVHEDEIIVAVIWDIDKWGGSSHDENLMLLSQPRTIKEIQEIRDNHYAEQKEKLSSANMSKIEMLWS